MCTKKRKKAKTKISARPDEPETKTNAKINISSGNKRWLLRLLLGLLAPPLSFRQEQEALTGLYDD